MNLDIHDIMFGIHKDISSGNLIFANENQFQFELAWRIKEKYKNYDVLFEVVYLDDGVKTKKQNSTAKNDEDKKNYTDLVIVDNNSKEYISIELKYKTVQRNINDKLLKNHGAQGLAGYDYLNDLFRLEKLQTNTEKQFKYYDKYKDYKFNKAYAIILTNDKSYYSNDWKGNQSENFTFHNDHKIEKNKKLDWIKKGQKKNNFGKNRQDPIILNKDYICKWNPAVLGPVKSNYSKNNFYYLILDV